MTVDNTRSTDSVRFTLRRSSSGVAGEVPGYEESVLLAAGGVAVRVIPLVDDASKVVSVISDAPAGGILATRSSVCGELPVASVGALDCDALSTVVTLDNSRMPASTVYTVHSGEPLQLVERAVEVPPGEIAAISVSLVPNAFNEVRVNLSRRVVIAAASGVCGTWVDGPRASIGPLECGRDAAVTLDNSRSSARSAFLIQRTVAGDDHSDDARLVLGAGEVRVVPVTLEEGTITDVLVRARDEHGAVLASVEGPLCGLLTVGPVDCDTETFEVTLVNDDADHEYSREFFVSSTAFRMHRTAYHQEVRLAVGERRVLTVPVAGLLGGDLRLEEPGTMDGAVLYEEPVEVDCPAGADSSESPPASGSLAATGAGGLRRLVLAGVALFAVGGALILVATASRRNLHLRAGKEVART